jgi:hypothetical protein
VLCGGIVDGAVVGGKVGGTEIVVVGGGSGASVVVVAGGGSVVAVVVATGGAVVAGALVPKLRGAVVATPGWVFPVPPGGMVATVVVLESAGDDVVVGPLDVVGAPAVVDVGRRVEVVVGDWVATCSFGDVSLPVATSKSMAARAMVART